MRYPNSHTHCHLALVWLRACVLDPEIHSYHPPARAPRDPERWYLYLE